MKLLLLFVLVACATASVYNYEALDDVAERVYTGLMLEEAEEVAFSNYAEDEVTTDVGKKLKEMLDKIIEKIKERIEKGKEIGKDLKDKLKEVRDKIKEFKVKMDNKAKDMLKKIRERVRKILEDLLNRLGDDKTQRSVDEFDIVEQLAESRLRDMFNKLKDFIRGNIDKEKLKQKIHDIFGKGNKIADSLLEIIQTKGEEYKDKLHQLIDRYLGKKETRSIKEMWEKVKNYFKDLNIDLKEKYAKFGEYVKDHLSKYLEKGKDKISSIKEIAKEFIDHTKGVSKDVAAEALEFLRPYKEDLGGLWDQVKVTVKDILNRKD